MLFLPAFVQVVAVMAVLEKRQRAAMSIEVLVAAEVLPAGLPDEPEAELVFPSGEL